MQTSFKQLITEHDAIEAVANALLAAVEKGDAGSVDLAVQLNTLAVLVKDHVEREDMIIADFNEAQLSGPWIEAWREGADAFAQLKAEWTRFLKTWNAEAIYNDRIGFTTDAHSILGRLRDRVQLETRTFYATALQTGAIGLR
ncbi:MAG: hypothetical protein EOP64_07700 [Sphingomonas sp.]|nr:MAG: hypothetical protein EOP64_07700 [Sphingomonas sp.]